MKCLRKALPWSWASQPHYLTFQPRMSQLDFLRHHPYLVGLQGLELQDLPWDQECHHCPVDPWVQEEPECFLQLVFGQEHLGGQKSLWAGGGGGGVWKCQANAKEAARVGAWKPSFLPHNHQLSSLPLCPHSPHWILPNVLVTHLPAQWIGSSLSVGPKLYSSCFLRAWYMVGKSGNVCCKYRSLRLGWGLGWLVYSLTGKSTVRRRVRGHLQSQRFSWHHSLEP